MKLSSPGAVAKRRRGRRRLLGTWVAMRYHATRPPLRRMKAIDQALRAGRWPTDKSLAAELEADPRTIRRDLEYMRYQLQAPIAYSRAQRGYYYSEDTYRSPFLQLSEGELISGSLAERMMRQFRGTPFDAELRRAIKRGEMQPERVADPLGPEPSASAVR
jgi:predicted DNA-binding transcriptional regulator YafY